MSPLAGECFARSVPIDTQLAGIRAQQHQHHIGERRLACAGGTGQSQPFAMLKLEIDAAKNPSRVTVAERLLDADV